MKKRCICLLLAALLAVLSGCAGSGEKPRVKDGIYASCGNYNFTIYKGLSTVHSIRFYLTCEDLLPEGTEVRVDMDGEYSYTLKDTTPDTLTNACFYGDATAKVTGMELLITSTSGEEVSTLWEPGDALQLRKGETVAGTVSFTDENLSAAEYGSSTVLMLEFDRGGETTVLTCSLSLFRRRNPQEVYLWAFRNADVQGYYQYLYGAS